MGLLMEAPFTGMTAGGGESELVGGELGSRFYIPDAESKRRLARYNEAERLLDIDEHVKLFEREKGAGAATENWIPLDLPGMLGRLMRHYALGDTFQVLAQLRGEVPDEDGARVTLEAEAQEQVSRIGDNSEVECLLRQSLEVLPAMGDGVIRVDIKDAEEAGEGAPVPQAFMRYVAPQHYFPKLSPVDQTQVEEVTLAWVFTMSGSDIGNAAAEQMVLREVHTVGQVDYLLHRWDGSKVGDALPLSSHFPGLESFSTGIDEIPVVHLGWQTKAGKHFGESELLRVAPIILALENRLAQVDEVLEKHARPKLVVGPGVLDEQGKARLKDFDVIEVSPDIFEKAVRPEYLTWDAQLDGVRGEIEKLEEYFFMTTETSPASFGLERDGSQVESARALRFKAHRTVNKAEDARKELAKDIRALYRIAQKLELAARKQSGTGAGYRRSDVVPVYGDPILEDQTQEVTDYVMRKQAGLVSRVRAIMDLEELPRAAAEVMVREILQDEVDEAAAASATLGGPDDVLGIGEAGPPAGTPTEPEAPPANLSDEDGVGVAEDVQKTVLNGGQVGAMQAIVVAVAEGKLPRDSAAGILTVAFGLTAEAADSVLGSVVEGSSKPVTPPAFGARPPEVEAPDEEAEAEPEDA